MLILTYSTTVLLLIPPPLTGRHLEKIWESRRSFNEHLQTFEIWRAKRAAKILDLFGSFQGGNAQKTVQKGVLSGVQNLAEALMNTFKIWKSHRTINEHPQTFGNFDHFWTLKGKFMFFTVASEKISDPRKVGGCEFIYFEKEFRAQIFRKCLAHEYSKSAKFQLITPTRNMRTRKWEFDKSIFFLTKDKKK